MKLNTLISAAIVLIVLPWLTGCNGVIDLTTDGRKLHIEFKQPAQVADTTPVGSIAIDAASH